MSTQMPEPDETRRENEAEFVDGAEVTSGAGEEFGGEANAAPPQSIPPTAPPVDPAVGEVANEEVTQARRDIEAELRSNNMDLQDVFEQSASETTEGTEHRVVGHMHLKAVLAAYFNDNTADEIINSAGLRGDQHIDTIGSQEQQDLLDLIEAYE